MDRADTCRCGVPDASAGNPESARAEPTEPKATEQLPEAPPAPNPAARRRLLAEVRDKSEGLQPCRSNAMRGVRFTVTLTIGEGGKIQKVALNAPDGEVSRQVRSCLRDRMSGWALPAELLQGRREIVFGLEL